MEQAFTDILIRIRKGSRISYPVEAWLSDGSFYEGKARLASGLRQQLLRSYYDPKRYGEMLFKALFDGSIATAYDVATGLARQQSEGRLRIRLLLDESAPAELHALKWERLANLQGMPLAVSDFTPFSRYTALPKEEPTPLDAAVVHLLFVVSAPSDLEAKGMARIYVDDEIRLLKDALADIWCSERCQATILPGQSSLSSGLRAELKDAGCRIADGNATLDNIVGLLHGQHVLHFLGHGQYKDGHGYLLLEQEDGALERVVDTDLAVKLFSPSLRLVFLTACESGRRDARPADGATQASSFLGLAATLVQYGIPAVVGMQEAFTINAAYRLTGEFYRRLFLEHGAVDQALNEARAMLYREDEVNWCIPVLTMRLITGQLAIANPVWTALHEISEDPIYETFQAKQYIDLPLQAILVNEGQDLSQFHLPEHQRIGTFDLIDAILRYLKAHSSESPPGALTAPLVLVLGGPGASKSTQMKRLGWKTLQVGLNSPNEELFLPLHLSEEEYWPGSSEALEIQILDKLRQFIQDLSVRSLDDLAEELPQVRLRIIISAGDTLPEVGRDLVRLTVALAQDHPRHQFILAIQPSALNWDDLKDIDPAQRCILSIQPLTERGIRHALQAQGEAGQRLLDELYDTSLFDLASTPFFFVDMLTRARKGQKITSRAQVLQQLIDEAIARIPAGQGMRANALRSLLKLALEMQRSDLNIWPIEEAFRLMSSVRGERGYKEEELYASLVKQRLLLPVGEDAVRFSYSSIQAYCSARAILEQPEHDMVLHELVESLGSPLRMRWWEETLVIVSGLLAIMRYPGYYQTLRRILEPIINGEDLLEGEQLFLGARCLLECRSVLAAAADAETNQELAKLIDHIVNALGWRSESAIEPNLARRLEATQLLAQLAMPKVAIDLAHKAYSKVRRNLANEWDYEFSSVRFAAAIALKRMTPERAEEELKEIDPKLVELFNAWKERKVEALIQHSNDAEDLGIQGLAALALGDLHGPLESADQPEKAQRVLERLSEMLTSGETKQNVRWSVADALSLLDSARIAEKIVYPLLDELSTPDRTSLKNPAKIRKTLAYLIGLLRLRDERSRNFLVRECLGLEGDVDSKDWSTWATAIKALGRTASEPDMRLLANIAAGRAKGKRLSALFPNEMECNYIRWEAINALASQGDLDVLSQEDRNSLAKHHALYEAYYQAIQEIYWRREAAARAGLGETP